MTLKTIIDGIQSLGGRVILLDILVPLVSVLISGIVSLVCVYWTIRHESNKDREMQKQSVHPWIFSFEDEWDSEKYRVCQLFPESNDVDLVGVISGIIKNTDNGVCLIDCIKTENSIYFPTGSTIIDKNELVQLRVNFEIYKENLCNWKLYIHDIYENHYCYVITINGTHFEIGKCEEVKK